MIPAALFALLNCQRWLERAGADAVPASLVLRLLALRPGAIAIIPSGANQPVSPLRAQRSVTVR